MGCPRKFGIEKSTVENGDEPATKDFELNVSWLRTACCRRICPLGDGRKEQLGRRKRRLAAYFLIPDCIIRLAIYRAKNDNFVFIYPSRFARWDPISRSEMSPSATQSFWGASMATTASSRIQVVKGDITKLDVDAIVNAANESLLGGGGVDGAIHRAAGPGLLAECRQLGGCRTGQAKLTGGHNLRAKHVIHTVGPVYDDGRHDEPELLRSCYRESLRLATEAGMKSLAFPCISTGAYGYPKREACAVAVTAVTEWLMANELPLNVTFCCFGADDVEIYRAQLKQ
jgi:O-acetyl-ADP-ribose deacetylase (regulator of RNase III)